MDKLALRWSKYILFLKIEEGYLAWNTLTNSLIILNDIEEVGDSSIELESIDDLFESAFLVSDRIDEDKRLREIRKILNFIKKNFRAKIFTTLSCNARCPYCFEKDVSCHSMDESTALDVVKFIKDTNTGEKIALSWFGGEPLVNIKVIDLISAELRKLGIEFKSDMTTNGYLFDEEIIRRAVDLWNLKKVQITLDGTEEVYNKTKAYVSANESAYKHVIKNIGLLSETGIKVNIRLNLSFDNSENLMVLAEELSWLFAGKENILVYVMPLYEYFKTDDSATIHTVFESYKRLVKKLTDLRLYRSQKLLPQSLPLNHCMADNDYCYTILPTGKIGKCGDYCDSNFVGDIWNGITDMEKVEWFKQRVTEEKCKTCVLAPSCTLLNACSVKCNELYRLKMRFDLEQSMLAAYRKWKEENKRKENETEE